MERDDTPGTDRASPPASGRSAARWMLAAVAFVWLATGLAVLHPEYRRLGEADLASLGLPAAVMYATCAAEVVLGLRVALGRAATWLTLLQVATILGFTAILTASQPHLWLHPLGVLTKNLPLLVLLGTAWLVEREGWSRRAVWLLRGGLAAFWLADGVLAWLLGDSTAVGIRRGWVVGVNEIVLAAAVLLLRGPVLQGLLAGYLLTLAVVTGLATVHDPLLWVHPFGPLTKTVPLAVATVVVMLGAAERG
jgi:hypothetical protein